jgi:hypothetical protein
VFTSGNKVIAELERGYIRFEVFISVTAKNDVFWDVAPCGSYKSHTV